MKTQQNHQKRWIDATSIKQIAKQVAPGGAISSKTMQWASFLIIIALIATFAAWPRSTNKLTKPFYIYAEEINEEVLSECSNAVDCAGVKQQYEDRLAKCQADDNCIDALSADEIADIDQ